MSKFDKHACNEYNELSRRDLIATSSLGLFSLAMPSWLPRVTLSESFVSSRDVIIQIYLRGGADGLSMCVPYGDPAYFTNRPLTSMSPPGTGSINRFASTIDLDGFFSLPYAMRKLRGAWDNQNLLFVHATGSVDPSRSHFDAQRYMEVGKPADPTIATGWLGRHLATSASMLNGSVLRGISMGTGLAKTLAGAPLTLPIPNVASFNFEGDTTTRTARRAFVSNAYLTETDPMLAAAQNTQATIDLLSSINFSGYVPAGGAVYPTASIGSALKSSAALIRADVGVEAIAIDAGGWDLHSNMGSRGGAMSTLLQNLAGAMGAFWQDLQSAGRFDNVLVVAMSEFGRTAKDNSNAGTDHGHGNCMMLMGGGVIGGRVYRNGWPGLGAGQLYQNQDLAITLDHRDVLAEIVAKRLGNAASVGTVFPNYTPTYRDLVMQIP